MKNLIKLVFAFVLMASCSSSDDPTNSVDGEKYKRYLIESGKIEYVINTSGNVLSTTIKGEGTGVTYFKKWGNLEILKESQTTNSRTVLMTGEVVEETSVSKSLDKLEDLYAYSVDFENNKITKRRDLVLELIRNDPNFDPITAGEEIMIQNGGEKLDNEEYMGYDCVVWSFLGSKLWGYKGVTLKVETNLGGIQGVKKAVSIEFNIPLANALFELPNYPIEEI